MNKIGIAQKFAQLTEHWRPRIIATLNGQEVKIVKLQGIFPWHTHADIDELFLVWRGRLRIEFRDHITELAPGEILVVPRGTEHRTAADEETEILLFEPAGTLNTGNIKDSIYTASLGIHI